VAEAEGGGAVFEVRLPLWGTETGTGGGEGGVGASSSPGPASRGEDS